MRINVFPQPVTLPQAKRFVFGMLVEINRLTKKDKKDNIVRSYDQTWSQLQRMKKC